MSVRPNLRPDGVSSCSVCRLEMLWRCVLSRGGSQWPWETPARYNLSTVARDELPPAEPGPVVASGPLLLAPSPNPAKPKTKWKASLQGGG